MRKILSIVWKDIRETYTDSSLLLIMLATPLVLATIIALAFSDISSGGAPLQDIPVALVNLDDGYYGALYVNLLVPDSPEPEFPGDDTTADCPSVETTESVTPTEADTMLFDLTEATVLTSPDAARAGVDDGTYAAAVIIPAGFTDGVSFSETNMAINPPPIEVYGDSNRQISAGVIRSIIDGITSQLLSSQIIVGSTYQTLIENGDFALINSLDNCIFSAAFDASSLNTINVEKAPTRDDDSEPLSLILFFGASQAVFFALFTASGAAGGILEERRNGTLQRLIVSPTPRSHILFAKLLSVFATVLLQVAFLIAGFMFVASMLAGEFDPIWGTNWFGIGVLIIVVSLAVSGVGMVVGAVAKDAEQANIVGSVIALFMGAAGGAFFQISDAPGVFDLITRLSVVKWGQEGFIKLAEGNNDILVNLGALLVIGAVLFILSMILFNRRQDI